MKNFLFWLFLALMDKLVAFFNWATNTVKGNLLIAVVIASCAIGELKDGDYLLFVGDLLFALWCITDAWMIHRS